MPHNKNQGTLSRRKGVRAERASLEGFVPTFAQSQCQPIGSFLDGTICSFGETRRKLKSSEQTLPFLTADHSLFITAAFHLTGGSELSYLLCALTRLDMAHANMTVQSTR